MSKIGILGDLHLRATKPVNRIDDYCNTQFTKLEQAFSHFKEENCSFVLQPGDFFNNYGNDPYSILYDVIAFLMIWNIPIYGVFGQHDIKFHNTDIEDVPIQILNKTSLFTRILNRKAHKQINTILYGASWNEPIPRIKDQEGTHILIMHKMVIKGRKLWPGQTDYLQARKLANSEFDLIITGDNHQAFTYQQVINCGSLMRMTIAQTEHEPIYGIFDSQTKELQTFKYDIEEADLVLKEQEIREEQINDSKKEEFKDSLNTDFEGELNFRNNIDKVMSGRKRIRKETENIVEAALNE